MAGNPMGDKPAPARSFAQKFRQRLVRQYMVRFHMSLLLMATMCAGVISSKLLLMAGVHSVLVRYPLAVLIAYLSFAGLARLWVAYVLIDAVAAAGHRFFSGKSSASAIDANLDLPLPGDSTSPTSVSFGGGDSGGGGASDVWDTPSRQVAAVPSAPTSGGSGFHFPSLNLDIDFDDGFWILVVLAVLVIVLACAGGYLIWAAPQILPDLALNALFASSFAGAAKRAQTRGWMLSVFRATVIPFALVLAATIALAAVIHHHCPGADKLGTALACPAEMRPSH